MHTEASPCCGQVRLSMTRAGMPPTRHTSAGQAAWQTGHRDIVFFSSLSARNVGGGFGLKPARPMNFERSRLCILMSARRAANEQDRQPKHGQKAHHREEQPDARKHSISPMRPSAFRKQYH